MREPIAKEFLMLTKQWENSKPETIADNVEKRLIELIEIYPECTVRSVMYDILSEMTGSSKHTVYAWFNKSRNRIKIPLIKLCLIAEELNTDIKSFLMEGEE